MKFIFKSIIDTIIDTNAKAMENGRVIEKVELSQMEFFKLQKECPVFPGRSQSIRDIKPGVKGMVDGITVEVV